MRACSTASKSDCSVTCSRFSATGLILPTANVRAPSATQPSSVTPMSIEMTSPSSAACTGPGMPCTTIAFGDAQIEPGKPR